MTLAAIFGCSGPTLSPDEAAFFREVRPWGFILFGRNIENPDQVRGLVDALRNTVDGPSAPVLIDQEGGRVQRLKPPHWPAYPPGRAYGAAQADAVDRRSLARLGGRLVARDLAALGITVDCAPVADVPARGAHDIIGDRAYAEGSDEVATLARAFAEGLIAGGVLPVIKHIPGHGRATADSHAQLPVVRADLEELDATDFAPFRMLSDMPAAMTAHVVYAAVDAKRPATTSRRVVSRIIREAIGFEGLLISDDLSMKALSGDFARRAREASSAGCDIVLHCNGDMSEMAAVASGARTLRGRPAARATAALGRLPRTIEPIDVKEAQSRFDAAFGPRDWAGGQA